MPRPSSVFTDGAFAPMSPIQPVPLDTPPPGGTFADPRWWQYPVGWNLPTQPGSEGLKLCSFDQLKTLSERYSVARQCIELRKDEILGLNWEITMTTDAAKAYQGDRKAMRDFGERKAEVTRFFKRPDPDYWSFSSFLDALLEEIFVYDALAVVYRPKYGASFGMGGRGLLGSDLDSLNLVSGPCYSDDTEVLTRRGWLKFADTTTDDEFATRNPKTKVLEWQQPTYFHKEAWNSELINFHSRWLDILVTPNHRMLVTSKPHGVHAERHGDEWIIPAGVLADKGGKSQLIPHVSENDSPDLASFRIPASRQAPFTEISGDDFAAFMGMWLAEGCVTWHGEHGKRKRPTIYVTQDEKSRGYEPYRELLNRIRGSETSYSGHSFYFRHAGLAEYLKQFGHAHEKFVPEEVLNLSARQSEIFWHYYWLGDGYADRQRICTSSPRMADDLQVLAQRMGKWATVSVEKSERIACLPDGHLIDQSKCHPKYKIALQSHSASQWHASPVSYNGFVYCVSLPNETMYVRRNGKPSWCCNTIRPLLDLHGGRPRPPAPAYQQYLYGVPRSDYMTMATGRDIDDAGLAGAEVNEFQSDVMLYAPLVSRRETPYGFPFVERALLPIISGLQKQEFQLNYFTEGTVPAVYISPGDTNITPTQIGELQNALNAIAGDPAYHLKVVVLPPGSKVEPQRPVDLSDSFDYLVMNQVCMAADVQPEELGIIPNVGATPTGPSAAGIRMAGQESRSIQSRKSAKPLLKFVCNIFNYAIQDICNQHDMQFQFEGLVNDEDKQAITELGVQQVQNAIASIDEVRERLDLPPWGLEETGEPVVFTAQGPVPVKMASELIMMAAQSGAGGGQGTNGGQKAVKKKPKPRKGGGTKPNGSHPAPLSPHREGTGTPQHSAAQGAVQSPTPRTGGTTSRASTAGSRKKGAAFELESLKRHLRKGRDIATWTPVHISSQTLGMIAEDIAEGVTLDTAIDRAMNIEENSLNKSWSIDDERLVDPFDEEDANKGFPAHDPEYLHDIYCDNTYCNHKDFVGKSATPFPGWEHDLGLIGRYKQEIAQGFGKAEEAGSAIRQEVAMGKLMVPNRVMYDLISEKVRETLAGVMTPLWEKAWNLGYDSANQLLGKDAGILGTTDNLQAFLDTEGAHWLDQIARTGLKNASSRSEVIARTEIARAMNAGVIQCYRDNGVTHKQLGIAPDDPCKICKRVANEGAIPLDSPFSSGGLGGPLHIQCRCVPLPAGMDVIPPQSHLGKSEVEDHARTAWLLIRAKDEKGKWRYLLQQRPDGSWGMPGGTTHVNESGWSAAYRETEEEIGVLPALAVIRDFTHQDPDGQTAYLYLCETSMFKPLMNGSTPEETLSTGWFRRGEIEDLDLVGKFRDDWVKEIHLRDQLGDMKSLQNMVNENGEWMVLDDPDRHGAGMGARWPYPHHSNGEEYGDAGPGGYPGVTPGGNPPHFEANMMDTPLQTRVYPHGHEDEFPEERDVPPARRKKTPPGGFPLVDPDEQEVDSPGVQDVSANTGIPPSGKGIHPVVGSVPARTPRPMNPHSEPPETFDPGDTVEQWSPEAESDIVHDLPPAKKGAAVEKSAYSVQMALDLMTERNYYNERSFATPKRDLNPDADLADPSKPGGPSDYSDPNETAPEHVLNQLRSNFPEKSIEWVKRTRWIGPIQIPWERVDDDSIDSWAASHQADAVSRFARDIKANRGHTNPSVLVQRPGQDRAFIVDGHHRALARRKLGQPVLAYVGFIQSDDLQAVEETHSSQFHSGSDLQNKSQGL